MLEIHSARLAILEFEDDTPRAIDMNGVARRRKTKQGMEIEPGQVHILGRSCRIERIEPGQDALCRRLSIFDFPLSHRRASSLFLKVLIMA